MPISMNSNVSSFQNPCPLLETNTLPPPPAFTQNNSHDYFLPNGKPAFELLESDLPILVPFMNSLNIPTTPHQQPENRSYDDGLIYPRNSLNYSMGLLRGKRQVEVKLVRFVCSECRKGFHSSQALGGHKSYHSKMRKFKALTSRAADTDQHEPTVDVENTDEPPTKIPRIENYNSHVMGLTFP